MIENILIKILRLSRRHKQFILALSDFFLLPLSLYIAYTLRLGKFLPLEKLSQDWWIFLAVPIITIPFFFKSSLYHSILKYMGAQAVRAAIESVTLSTLVLGFFMMLFKEIDFPRSVLLIFWFVAILMTLGNRFFARWLLYTFVHRGIHVKPVAIYGAGKAGAMLQDNIRKSDNYRLIALIDDDPQKWGTILNSEVIYPPDAIDKLIRKKGLKLILMAIPSMGKKSRREKLMQVTQYPVEVKELPGLEKLIDGQVTVDDVINVEVEDILGREPVEPIEKLLHKNITGKNVVVTGAGGSIGTELCLQILELKPACLVMMERSEYALYKLSQDSRVKAYGNRVVPVLGSVLNRSRLRKNFEKYKVHTIYHAAAYKHVPMVEINPVAGVWNNVFGTFYTVMSAHEAGVESFVLISTDKAVRPTNVMGASKRISELILQGMKLKGSDTCFTMVRFGNVLDSAGSVVPLFREQINSGGPVTVTHEEVIRFFMSIPEAVQLVIQAGAMSLGGEVFVLDMGDPVRILDLANRMVYLSGLVPITPDNPNGDIDVVITGLRPGEKLYEELLIGDGSETTEHPRIMRANEECYEWSIVRDMLAELEEACLNQNEDALRNILKKYVKGYAPQDPDSLD